MQNVASEEAHARRAAPYITDVSFSAQHIDTRVLYWPLEDVDIEARALA